MRPRIILPVVGLLCLIWVLWAAPTPPPLIRFVSVSPTGACGGAYLVVNRVTSEMLGCIAGTWAWIGNYTPPGAGATKLNMIQGSCPGTAVAGWDLTLCVESGQLCGVTAGGVKSCGFGAISPLTDKGDLYTYSTTGARLPVGANGRFLAADSTKATGLDWVVGPAGASDGVVQTKAGAGLGGSVAFTWKEGFPGANKNLLSIRAGSNQVWDDLVAIEDAGGVVRGRLLANAAATYIQMERFVGMDNSFHFGPGALDLGSTALISFASGVNYYDAKDSGLARVAAGVVRVTDGTTGYGRIAVDSSTPANAAAACTAKSMWADANYVYVCVASGDIRRSAIATW